MKIKHPYGVQSEVREGAGAGRGDEAYVGSTGRQVDDGLLPFTKRVVSGDGPELDLSVVVLINAVVGPAPRDRDL
jgi:hypothetical protein